MAALLNAMPGRRRASITATDLRDWMAEGDIWHVAERAGELCGFQWIGVRVALPPGTCEIATFMARGEDGIDAGSALFAATCRAAKAHGHRTIRATVARGNAAARSYYRSRGFEERLPDPRLADPALVNQVVTLYRI